MSVTDINAEKNWRGISKEIQYKLLSNVFCSNCYNTTIVDYTLHDHDQGILLKGKCKQCGGNVARVVERDWWESE